MNGDDEGSHDVAKDLPPSSPIPSASSSMATSLRTPSPPSRSLGSSSETLEVFKSPSEKADVVDCSDCSGSQPTAASAHIDDASLPPSLTRDSNLNFFDAYSSKSMLRKSSQSDILPDSNGYVFTDLGKESAPLICFVNSRSGGNQGKVLIRQLKRVLNPIQVWDLADGGPEKVLKSFVDVPKSRILVCGGDGTVAWIMGALESMKPARAPPIAILPLGTGNDLARIHGWGGGFNNESLLGILEEVANSYVSLLDRWEVSIERKNKQVAVKTFNNYFGIGADAQAALDFHSLRENKPELFFSRLTNKIWYAVLGAEDIFKASCDDIPERVTLIADGVEVPVPDDSQGLVLLNIDSYAGGIKLWATGSSGNPESTEGYIGKTKNNRKRLSSIDSKDGEDVTLEDLIGRAEDDSSCQDGMIDIISIRGCLHLGQINIGLSQAQRICQCKEIEIKTSRKYPCQLDGEPWGQAPCVFKIRRKKEQAVMLHSASKHTGGDVATEMIDLLDWAEERGIIRKPQHAAMTREFSRRIEARNRITNRVTSTDNLVSYGASVGRTLRKGITIPFLQQAAKSSPSEGNRSDSHFQRYQFSDDTNDGTSNHGKDDCCVA